MYIQSLIYIFTSKCGESLAFPRNPRHTSPQLFDRQYSYISNFAIVVLVRSWHSVFRSYSALHTYIVMIHFDLTLLLDWTMYWNLFIYFPIYTLSERKQYCMVRNKGTHTYCLFFLYEVDLLLAFDVRRLFLHTRSTSENNIFAVAKQTCL